MTRRWYKPLSSPSRAVVSAATCALTLMCGGVLAQTPAAAGADSAATLAASVASLPLPAGAGTRSSRSTLKQLGIDYEITLRGVQGAAGVPFSVRTDQVVDRATLHLKYSYSPALIPDLSHIRVTVNDVTVATLPVPTEQAGSVVERNVDIDPRLIIDYNRVNLQLIGHYTRDCEDPDHSSLWANIDSGSYLELAWTPLRLANDLSLLPAPFFDSRDTNRLELPFVFAGRPGHGLLQSGGVVSSWFGALAGYRGARFPVLLDSLPVQGNAVVLATPSTVPAGLTVPAVAGPTVAVMANPNDADGKLLLVLGRDDKEVADAAKALALGTPLTGASMALSKVADAAPRKPYDAPNWIQSDRPVRFADLVGQSSELNVVGYHPDLIRVGLQLPPDLFVWRREGIPLDLRYRYTLPEGADKSALNVSINDAFVTTLPLNGQSQPRTVPGMLWNKLKVSGKMPVEQDIILPTGPFSASSQLRFHFFFDRPKADACKNTMPDVSAAIDGDSTIDLTSFHHFMAMPNLAAFGNAGFPFTRMADLSDTALVLPDNASADDMGNLLGILGRMGASTGYPSLRPRVITAGEVGDHADADLIVMGSRRNQPLFDTWSDKTPIGQAGKSTVLSLSDWLFEKMPAFLSPDARRTDLPTVAEVGFDLKPDDVVLMGFESPLQRGRSVVAVMADDPVQVNRLFQAWFDPEKLRQFQGSVVLLQNDKVLSLAGNQSYYVGKLPWLVWLRWYFSQSPLLLAALVGLGCSVLALLARWLLKRHAQARIDSTR